MAYDNAAIVRRFFDEVWSKGNLGVVDELVSANCVSHDPVSGDLKGCDSIKAQVEEYRRAFPDLQFTIDDLLVSGEKVVVRWTATGTHKGPIMGVAATGKLFSIEGITCERMANGKSVEHWAQWDTMKFLQILGIVPALGKAASRPEVREARPH
jgi:steroid delta-isomerase-like uncharacterized protein